MIAKLKGILDSITDSYLIIDINGVGYQVYSSGKTLMKLIKEEGSIVSLFIETHVREDRIHLFGFLDNTEKVAFNMLQSVSGIGTKMALHILSNLTPHQLQVAISSQNRHQLKAISGVGPKLIDRLMIELRDKVANINTIANNTSLAILSTDSNTHDNILSDAITALIALGISRAEATQILSDIYALSPSISVNELVRTALQRRAK
ncbi:Holliday junction branch migration protein RuvA [Orientia tsutsugamushi str. Gilliam]|uniref:Holliday junction branch migration complex subunit RuvA n=1 Tax=Orientia tsutsugamushi str. Gilliam TaxID=1359184 RepID=A0A2U3QW71_ORITS|nr:Holliday junction branch migration protein RuvA [Orientia tsutsugamushi]KJV75512.1 holliday junction DNA helicase RuvA [Orientia tsutsugamushi str. TA763]SPP23621.1 Holliday junction branch migration protein RuvA [Orientia tsutsugamushi]SPR05182.1 Holliday junction branch migration protein RuvA [Orientia tsutsugamushi str. Gilliam]